MNIIGYWTQWVYFDVSMPRWIYTLFMTGVIFLVITGLRSMII